jgi:hypothetical protein
MRAFVTLVLVAVLVGCVPSASRAPVSVPPSDSPTLAPEPTPGSLGTTQEIWLRDAKLLITPTKTVARLVRGGGFPSEERLYVAVKIEIESLGPGTWRPLANASLKRPTMCLVLKPETDKEWPLCGGSRSIPQYWAKGGYAWVPCLGPIPDPLFWQKEPAIDLSPLKAGESRTGWETWCLDSEIGSVNLDEYADGLRLTTLGVFGKMAEWHITLTP